jgi:hypothetical protein
MNRMTRREFTALAAGAGVASLLPRRAAAQSAAAPLITKQVPRSGERVPAVGLGSTAVTAVIPGTANPAHMNDNLGAMRGRLPDAALRKRMVEFLQSL